MDVLREVIALRQAGDVQASLALVDRSLAEGMSSNYLLDNRARALAQLNRENEAIQIWEVLSECGDLELQEKAKRLIYQYKCRSVLQHVVQLSQQGHATEALYVLDVARQIKGNEIIIKLSDSVSPTLVYDKDDKGVLFVLMPMRV